MMLNGLPWEQTEIILSFLRLHPNTAFQTLLLTVHSFFIFNYKEDNQFDFGIDHLVMSMCKDLSSVVERECLL